MTNPNAIQQPETSTSSEDITPRITTENRSETPKPRSQTKETVTPPNISLRIFLQRTDFYPFKTQ